MMQRRKPLTRKKRESMIDDHSEIQGIQPINLISRTSFLKEKLSASVLTMNKNILCDLYTSSQRIVTYRQPKVDKEIEKRKISRSLRKPKRELVEVESIVINSQHHVDAKINQNIEQIQQPKQQEELIGEEYHVRVIKEEEIEAQQYKQAIILQQIQEIKESKEVQQTKEPQKISEIKSVPIYLSVQSIRVPQSLLEFKKLLLTPTHPSSKYVCLIKITKTSLKPTFLLYSSELNLLLSAEEQPISIGVNYYIFVGQPGEKRDKFYIGKLRGNFRQTCYSLYSYESGRIGNRSKKRYLVGNVISFKNNEGQQKVKVLLPSPENERKILKEEIKSLEECKDPNSVISMTFSSLKQQQNKLSERNLSAGKTKRTKQSQQKVNSRRIVISSELEKENLSLRKIQNNLFELSVCAPFSIFQAFGVVLAKACNLWE